MTGTMAPPRFREATFDDYVRIHELESVFFPDSLPPEQRRSLFLDNPLWPRLRDSWPIGWVLEDGDGRIVGSLNNIPSAYLLDGQERLCANGHCWAVLPEYRGYATILMDEYFSQERPDLLVSAKVGADATPVWSAYARRVPVGDWSQAAYAITHYPAFARAALRRTQLPFPGAVAPAAALALRVKDAATAAARGKRQARGPAAVEFSEARDFDERFDGFWGELVEQNPTRLLGVRDRASLRWHYGIPMRTDRLWVLTAARGGRIRAFGVLKLHVRPEGVRSMKLVDFQTVEPDADLLPGIVRLALRRSAAQGCAMLEHHGCGLPKLRGFDDVAPYRAVKPAWSFYYQALDPALESRLAEPATWDPSEYDGDSSYK
jgi:hypothetical protein